MSDRDLNHQSPADTAAVYRVSVDGEPVGTVEVPKVVRLRIEHVWYDGPQVGVLVVNPDGSETPYSETPYAEILDAFFGHDPLPSVWPAGYYRLVDGRGTTGTTPRLTPEMFRRVWGKDFER